MNHNQRVVSLDVLRGLDMLFIMGFTVFLLRFQEALGVRAEWLETQFSHGAWHGLRFYDTIFPLFLFLAGVSWPFSLARRRARGDSTAAIVRQILKRGLILSLLGFVYDGILKLDFANLIWGAVLTRIGIAWAIAALLSLWLNTRRLVAVAAAVLLGYWAVSVLVVAPDAPGLDPLSAKGCFAGWLDRRFMPGALTQPGIISNQGIFSTLPSVVTALLGIFAGQWLRRTELSGNRRTLGLLLAAAGLAALGCAVAYGFGRYSMPFNKILWSTSFTLAVGGYSAAMLALCYWLIDVKGWWRHHLFFKVIGMNSITIYMANKVVDFAFISSFCFGGLAGLLPTAWGEVLLLGGELGFRWLLLYFLYRHQVFLRV